MDPKMKREIILQHYQNPKNKGLIEDESYISVNMNNESCIDGEACAICTSSTSIMLDTLIGKTIEEAKIIVENFGNMIDEREYDSDILEVAVVYDDVGRQPNRKKCALLGWWGMEKVIEEHEKTL